MQREYEGWSRQILFTRGVGENYRVGWVDKYGWEKALEIHVGNKERSILTSGERLLSEVETVREAIFDRLKTHGVANRDLVYQHEKYSTRSAELLREIETARATGVDFAHFWRFLLQAALIVSPQLARELVAAEDAIMKRAKDEFQQ